MYIALRKGVRHMPDYDKDTIINTPQEDVDDLIFRSDPGWMASDR